MGNQEDLLNRLEETRYNLSMQIADNIQEMIESKQLKLSTKLPSERKLANRFGVNRVTLSKAMLLLEQRGLIKIRAGDGAYVVNVSSSVITDSIERYYKYGKGSDEELMVLREILEPEIAALAAANARKNEINKLKSQIKIVDEAFIAKDTERYILEDEIFHENLAEATHNELIEAIIVGLRSVMLPFKKVLIDKILIDREHAVHIKVVKAVSEKDPEAARGAMKDDIKAVRLAADF